MHSAWIPWERPSVTGTWLALGFAFSNFLFDFALHSFIIMCHVNMIVWGLWVFQLNQIRTWFSGPLTLFNNRKSILSLSALQNLVVQTAVYWCCYRVYLLWTLLSAVLFALIYLNSLRTDRALCTSLTMFKAVSYSLRQCGDIISSSVTEVLFYMILLDVA